MEFAGRGLLLDIEGTTTSVSFVYETLFPYARRALRGFLAAHGADPEVRAACDTIAREAGAASLAKFLSNAHFDAARGGTPLGEDRPLEREVLRRMDRDDKSTGLKQLQGLIWRAGYASGELRGHVYPDVPAAFGKWSAQGADIRIYSSGSVEAQRLLFTHSEAGKLDGYISGYYDTRVGPKRAAESYQRIVTDIGRAPHDVLFFSDVPEELEAARAAGLATVLVKRGENPRSVWPASISSFDEVRLV
jgi:enolase-phosphatase E1